MDWERGVKRVALVLAVVTGVLHCVLYIAYGGGWLHGFFVLIRLRAGSVENDLLALLIVFLIGFLPVWGVPTALCWAVRGFKDNRAAGFATGKKGQGPKVSGTDVERLKWLPGGSGKSQ